MKAVQQGVYLLIAGLFVLSSVTPAQARTIVGKSSSQSPYIIGAEPGVVVKEILTVGDVVSGPAGAPYRMVGIPDGMGAFDNGDGTFTVLMNHELRDTVGVERAHGARGAFVSRWVIDADDLTVLSGEDLIQQIATWDPSAASYTAPARGVTLSRLCSADLPAATAFYDPATGLGYAGRLFMNGEESGSEGRAFAHAMDGTSYELPWLGKFSWENSLAHPSTGEKTVVIGLDDSGNGQIYIYIGDKTTSGSPVEKAGLTGGTLYGVKVDGLARETDQTSLAKAAFTAQSLGDVSSITGAELETLSNASGVTGFNRPEDGVWDPNNPGDFYFVTTAAFAGKSRLWRLHFNNPAEPSAGGTAEMLLDGSEGQKMMDNLTINDRGQLLIQEDPGNQPHIAKIWSYNIAADSLSLVAQHDSARFTTGQPGFLTQDEESSGIIDVSSILGEGWYLLDVQAHYPHPDVELVEGGQLLAMHIPPGRK